MKIKVCQTFPSINRRKFKDLIYGDCFTFHNGGSDVFIKINTAITTHLNTCRPSDGWVFQSQPDADVFDANVELHIK